MGRDGGRGAGGGVKTPSLAQNRSFSKVHKFFFPLALYNLHFHFLPGNVLNCHSQKTGFYPPVPHGSLVSGLLNVFVRFSQCALCSVIPSLLEVAATFIPIVIAIMLFFSLIRRQQASSWLEKNTFITTSNFSYVYGKRIKS